MAQRGYLSRTQQRMSIKTIFNKLTSAAATERKAAVHAELKQREQLHQQKKARAAKQAALLRLANEKKISSLGSGLFPPSEQKLEQNLNSALVRK